MSLTSERLRTLREKKGLSQGEVAKLLGISRPAYVKYETGKSKPVRKIKELCTLFNVSSDYLLGNDIKIKDENTLMTCLEMDKDIKKDNMSLSKEEIDLIKKYRELPYAGKTTVKAILKSQYDLYVKPKSDEKAI